ncbi:MAG: cell envelope integrity protein TolA [Burkholderiaceae bacterium]|nr:cell envelope integrity protein TolA [Burkholderiaceae bacterium]
MSLAADRPEFTPPAPPGRLRAISLALLAHVVLIAALTWGVSWKRESNSSPVQAELWSATTQEAAPALVEPAVQPPPQPEPKPVPVPPPPPKPVPPKVTAAPPEPVIDPQIAIEQEKKKKADKQKLEKKKALAEAKAKAEAEAEAEEARQEALDKKKRLLEAKKTEAKKLDAKKAADEQAKKLAADKKAKVTKDAKDAKETAQIEAIRAGNMKRIAGLAGASGAESATGTAKQSSGPSPGYGGRVSARIKPNIVFTEDIAGNPTATVEVRTSPDGTIVGRKLTKSSGVKAWDEAVLRAVDKTETLPRDTDGRVPSSLEINFRPKD